MSKMTTQDRAVHEEFSLYGKNAREWMKKCVLMLPQIERQRIWEKKGFSSIYEYARVIAGMSRNKVSDSLRIIKKIEDKPRLMEIAEKKGLNAVRPVATIANPATDGFWAKRAGEMSKNTLETFVKDFKEEQKFGPRTEFADGKDLNKPNPSEKMQITMELDPEVANMLQNIKGDGDWNEAMKKMCENYLESAQKELEAEKPEPIQSQNHTAPVAIRNYIIKRSKGKCEHPNCNKDGEHFHHIIPFAIRKEHDPDKMLYLCPEHHKIIHLGYIRESDWQQIEGLPYYDLKNVINARIAEFYH